MVKWGIIAFVIGMALMFVDISMARKKKEGFTATDRQRVVGIFWITVFVTGLVVGLIYMSD